MISLIFSIVFFILLIAAIIIKYFYQYILKEYIFLLNPMLCILLTGSVCSSLFYYCTLPIQIDNSLVVLVAHNDESAPIHAAQKIILHFHELEKIKNIFMNYNKNIIEKPNKQTDAFINLMHGVNFPYLWSPILKEKKRFTISKQVSNCFYNFDHHKKIVKSIPKNKNELWFYIDSLSYLIFNKHNLLQKIKTNLYNYKFKPFIVEDKDDLPEIYRKLIFYYSNIIINDKQPSWLNDLSIIDSRYLLLQRNSESYTLLHSDLESMYNNVFLKTKKENLISNMSIYLNCNLNEIKNAINIDDLYSLLHKDTKFFMKNMKDILIKMTLKNSSKDAMNFLNCLLIWCPNYKNQINFIKNNYLSIPIKYFEDLNMQIDYIFHYYFIACQTLYANINQKEFLTRFMNLFSSQEDKKMIELILTVRPNIILPYRQNRFLMITYLENIYIETILNMNNEELLKHLLMIYENHPCIQYLLEKKIIFDLSGKEFFSLKDLLNFLCNIYYKY